MKIDSGQMGLYPSCRPPLTAGTYTVEVKQKLTKEGDGTPGSSLNKTTSLVEQEIKVEGPRFVLAPGEVHSMFPPPNDRGNFCNRLPQIVLRRRTLPWERTLDGDNPWMALLLVNEYDGVDAPRQMQVSDLLVEQNLLYPPDLPNITADELRQSCMAVDMGKKLFMKLCPTPEEVGLLAHVRVVSTEDKELLGQDEDGWFSVVTGHRFPDKEQGEEKAGGLVHRALLVSLEGQLANLTTIIDPADRVRLVVLASWEFTSKNNGDFQTTLTNIGKRGGVGLLGDVRHNCMVAGEGGEDRNNLVLETSHVPINQSYRTGEQGVGLYRGPLTPSPITYKSVVCHHADEALVVDPVTGLEQIGYGAAFELGRLLGASDESLAVGLMQWRKGEYETGQGQANVGDFLVELEIPLLFEEDLFGHDILDSIMDPLGPLINPARDFMSTPGNFIDRCGMSPGFVVERFENVTQGVAVIENIDVVAVAQDMEQTIFGVVNMAEMAEFNTLTFDHYLGNVMSLEIAYRQNVMVQNLQAISGGL